MEKELSIYISASPEMDTECELIGQRLAAMPKAVKWTIKRTPGRHELANPDLVTLRKSQFYLILLGTDITAPVGVEWLAARNAGLYVFAYRNMGRAASPAAAYFAHNSGIEWQNYRTPQEFIQHFERSLINRLLQHVPGYGLELSDLEELSAHLKALEKEGQEPEDEKRRGAGRGGVILPGRS